MKKFSIHPEIVEYSSFEDFSNDVQLEVSDLIITNEFIYNPFIKNLNLKCQVIFQEQYGQGEPSDVMITAIKKDIPSSIKRIIAVGGGTVIDISKFLTLDVEGSVEDAYMGRVPYKSARELMIVPTTCGTGSEVTNISIVNLTHLEIKKGLAIDELYAKKAVLIPSMIHTLPYRFFSTSSIDALAHAIESFLSPKATDYSRMFAEKAMHMILGGFKYVVKNGPEKWIDKADDFLKGSNFAGISFGNAGCAAVHALGYPISGKYHIIHGEAINLLLIETLKKYKEIKPKGGSLSELELLLSKELECEPEQTLEILNNLLEGILKRKRLKEYGMNVEEFADFAESVIKEQQRLLQNNYVALSQQDLVDIYTRLY